MKRLGKAAALLAVVVLGLSAVLVAQVGVGSAGTLADAESYLITSAVIASTDGAPAGAHTSFTVNCSGASSSPSWVTDGSAPTCSNGQLTISVGPTTRYYDSQTPTGQYCPTAGSGCFYTPSSYDAVIVPGQTLRVGGTWVRESYSSYQFYASYIWNPGLNVLSPPPDPKPSTVQDYDFSHRFVVMGQVVQAGSGLPGLQLWSQKWGIVVGQIPITADSSGSNGYSNNVQVEAIAAAHQDPSSGDPQLVVNMEDTYPANQISYAVPLTRYWVQSPLDGKFYPSDKAEATTCTTANPCPAGASGPQVQVAGSYGWLNGDWAFIAEFVWRPSPGPQPGYFGFNETAQAQPGTSVGTADDQATYSGMSDSGDGQVNPAGMTFNTTWSLSSDGTTWQVSADWTANRCQLPDGTAISGCTLPGSISGTLSGFWDPTTQQVTATVVMSTGTGKFCGYTGSGTFKGLAQPQVAVGGSPAPPTTFDGSFAIKVFPPSPTSGC